MSVCVCLCVKASTHRSHPEQLRDGRVQFIAVMFQSCESPNEDKWIIAETVSACLYLNESLCSTRIKSSLKTLLWIFGLRHTLICMERSLQLP